jgi:hypothetical protein
MVQTIHVLACCMLLQYLLPADTLPPLTAPLRITHVYSAVGNVTAIDALLLTIRLRPVVNWCNFKNDVDKVDQFLTPNSFSQSIPMGERLCACSLTIAGWLR